MCSGNAFEKFSCRLMHQRLTGASLLLTSRTGGGLFMCRVFLVLSCISNQVVTDTIALPHWSNCFQSLSVPWHSAAIFRVRTIDELYVTEKRSSCIMSTWVQIASKLKGKRESTGERNACSSSTTVRKSNHLFFKKIIAILYYDNPFWLELTFYTICLAMKP